MAQGNLTTSKTCQKKTDEEDDYLPKELLGNNAKTYYICGISPQDLFKYRGLDHFKLNVLRAKFKTICLDYLDPIVENSNSRAIEFCSVVLYQICPNARKVENQNKQYRIRFSYSEGNKEVIRFVIISSYRGAAYSEVFKEGVSLTLTTQLAGLLAMSILCQLIPFGLVKGVILLHPLSAMCFNKEDIYKIAKETGMLLEDVVQEINCSCIAGGEYLERSKLHIALCWIIIATRNLTDEKRKIEIIYTTLEQYYEVKKLLDLPLFEVYGKYVRGGLPESLDVKGLIAQHKGVSSESLSKACEQTATASTV